MLTNPDFMNPPIEIIATSPRLDMIRSRLKSAGLRPYEARNDMENTDPVLLDAISADKDQIRIIKRQLARDVDRPVFLLADKDTPPLKDAMILRSEAQLVSIPARLEATRRKKERLQEVHLRTETANTISDKGIPSSIDEPADLLFIGGGSARFLALSAALKNADIQVTAALTALTARDYLAEHPFSCVLLDLDENSPNATHFLEDFSNNPLLACVPIFVITAGTGELSPVQRFGLVNATEIIDAAQPVSQMAETIAERAEFHKAVTPMSADMTADSRIKDRMTGLFTPEFLERHLENQIRSLKDELTPLCLITLQLTSTQDGNSAARQTLPRLASLLGSELRQTDCAGRIDWSTIGISLRGTPYGGAVHLAERFTARLEGHRSNVAEAILPFGVTLSWRIVEKRRYHTAIDMINMGKRGPQVRLLRAA